MRAAEKPVDTFAEFAYGSFGEKFGARRQGAVVGQ